VPTSLLTNGYQGFFPWGVKWLGSEVCHSPPPSAEVKNVWSYTSTPPIRLHGVVLRDNFTFTFTITSDVAKLTTLQLKNICLCTGSPALNGNKLKQCIYKMKANIKLCTGSFIAVILPVFFFFFFTLSRSSAFHSEVNRNYHDGLCFFDELTFHVCGTVHRHVWENENPHDVTEHENSSPKVNVKHILTKKKNLLVLSF
jgi:hypothetical protein